MPVPVGQLHQLCEKPVLRPPAQESPEQAAHQHRTGPTLAVVVSILLSCLFKYMPGLNVLTTKGGGGWAIIISAILGAAICASIKEVKRHRKMRLAERRVA